MTFAEATRAYGGDRAFVNAAFWRLVRQGSLERVKWGLYVTDAGLRPPTRWDAYAVASLSWPGSAVAYRSALVVHGVAEDLREPTIQLLTSRHEVAFEFRGRVIAPTRSDRAFVRRAGTVVGRGGLRIDVTKPEWTVAMCARLLRRAGGFELFVRSAARFRNLDARELMVATASQDSPGLFNRVGYLAWVNKNRWGLRERDLEAFRRRFGTTVPYFGTRPGEGAFVRAWKLFVPRRSWRMLAAIRAADRRAGRAT